jgi:glycosyltransferase involved in cell wall biosynthesis
MDKKTIILLQGRSQYDVMNSFTTDLADAFSELGYDPKIISITKPNWLTEIINVLKSKHVAFFFSFNTAGVQLRSNDKALFDVLHVPLFTFLVDHPVYLLSRLNVDIQNFIVSCVDEDHVSFIKKYLDKSFQCLFIPHGASQKQVDIHWNSKRPIDILFSGTYVEPQEIQKKLVTTLGKYAELYDKIINASLYETFQPLEKTLTNIFTEESIDINDIPMAMFYQILLDTDKYVRNVRRKMIIEQLSHLDARVEVYGNGWSKIANDFKRINFYPPINYEKIQSKMGKSKIVLTVLPNFTAGGHERVFSSMSQGALSLVNENRYFQAHFSQDELVTYSFKENIRTKVRQILSNPEKLQHVAKSGQAKVMESHTWLNRAEQIISAVKAFQEKRMC